MSVQLVGTGFPVLCCSPSWALLTPRQSCLPARGLLGGAGAGTHPLRCPGTG